MNIVGSAPNPGVDGGDQSGASPHSEYATKDFDTSKFLNSYGTSGWQLSSHLEVHGFLCCAPLLL